MVDVLVVVERSESGEADIIATTIQRDLKKYFQALGLRRDDIPAALQAPAVEMVPNHGMAGTISLTSVVLATSLLENGISCGIYDDDNILAVHGDRFLAKVREARIVAFSTTYIIARKHVARMVQAIKKMDPTKTIIMGGQGVLALTLNPHSEEDAPIFDHVDCVVYGDAEETFPQVVKDYLAGGTAMPPAGVICKRDGKWVGDPVPQMADLDKAPVPDYGVFRKCEINGEMKDQYFRPDYASLEEGRGCAFRCRFCSYHVYSPFRRKSPQRIVAEMARCKAEGYDNVSFVGAEFLAPVKHSTRVLKAVAAAKLDMNIWLYARLDLCARHPELFGLLRDAGVKHLVFGMESGDESVLLNMKKFYRVEGMIEGAQMARKYGLKLMASFIIGYPGETAKTIETTIDVLRRCNFDHVVMHGLHVLPDTPLWDMRGEFGIRVMKNGYWVHDTMALKEIPDAARKIMWELSRDSDSVFVNVVRHLTPGFVRPGKDYSNQKLDHVSKLLQNILSDEWCETATPETRRRHWDRLSAEVTQLPDYVHRMAQAHARPSVAVG